MSGMLKTSYLMMAVAMILGVAVWWFSTPQPDLPRVPDKPVTFHWSSGCRASYDFSVSTDTDFGGQDRNVYEMDVTGILNMRVFEVAEKITVAFQLSPVRVTSDGEKDLLLETLYRTPFSVSLTPSGLIKGFDFPAGLPEEDQDMIVQLIGGLETILPLNDKALYTARQNDRMGSFVSKYRRDADGGTRHKLQYVDMVAASDRQLPLSTHVKDSAFDFIPDTEGCWLKVLSGEERIQIHVNENDFSTEAVTHISFRKQGALTADTSLWSASDPDALLEPFQRLAGKESIREIRRNRSLDNTLQSKGQTLSQLLDVVQSEGQGASLKLLERYLVTHPEAAEKMPELLISGQWSDEVVAQAILALGMAGSDAAQGALLAIWQDMAFSKGTRLQAVYAFTELKQPPTEAVFSTLTSSIYQLRTGGQDCDMCGTPIMVGGVVIQNIRENYPGVAEQLNRELLDLLDNTHDSAQVSTLLLALGNSRMEENAKVIGRYVSDPDSGVRETAIRMAGRYPGKESTLALQEQLQLESEPAIQANILKSLSRQPLAADDLEPVRLTLETSLDEGVREAAIEMLVTHKRLDPGAVNAALENAYQQETSRKTIKRIIQAYHRPVSKL
jgi:HEAT repeat protein